MSSTIWQPLSSDSCTRIVALSSDDDDNGVLNLQVHEIDLHQNPRFDAVSYVWGFKNEQTNIIVNNQHHAISRNLYGILLRLRKQAQARNSGALYLWIDALSIAQNDSAEKARHVQMIGRIFMAASTARSWTGVSDSHTKQLFRKWSLPTPRALRAEEASYVSAFHVQQSTITGRLKNKVLGRYSPFNTSQNAKYDQRNEEHNAERWQIEDIYDEHAKILLGFIRRPYFSRSWICQELIFAKNITLMADEYEMSWHELLRKFSTVWAYGDHPNRTANDYSSIDRLHSAPEMKLLDDIQRYQKDHTLNDLNKDLITLINRFRDTKQSQPHDRVYALLSLERPGYGEKLLQADYEIDMTQLFSNVLWNRQCHVASELEYGPMPSLPGRWEWHSSRSDRSSWPMHLVGKGGAIAYALMRDLNLGEPQLRSLVDHLDDRLKSWAKNPDEADASMLDAVIKATARAMWLRVHNQQSSSEGSFGISYSPLKQRMATGAMGPHLSNEKIDRFVKDGFLRVTSTEYLCSRSRSCTNGPQCRDAKPVKTTDWRYMNRHSTELYDRAWGSWSR